MQLHLEARCNQAATPSIEVSELVLLVHGRENVCASHSKCMDGLQLFAQMPARLAAPRIRTLRRGNHLIMLPSLLIICASLCIVAATGPGCYYSSSSSSCDIVVAASSNCTSEVAGGRAVTWLADAAASTQYLTVLCVVELQPSSFTLDMGTSNLIFDFAPTAAGVLPTKAFSGLTTAGDLSLSAGNVNGIQAGAFDGARLGGLDLSDNNLGVLPTHAFKGLTALYLQLANAGVTRVEPYTFQAAVFTSYKALFTAGFRMDYCLSLVGNYVGTVPAHAFSGLTCTQPVVSGRYGAFVLVGNASGVEPFAFDGLTVTGSLAFAPTRSGTKAQAAIGPVRADTFSGLVARELALWDSGITRLYPYAFRGVSLTHRIQLTHLQHVGVLPPHAFAGGVATNTVSLYNAGITGISPGTFWGCSMCAGTMQFRGNAISTLVSSAFAGLRATAIELGEAGVRRVEPRAFND